MKIALGCDHAGYELKGMVAELLGQEGHEVFDQGTFSEESCDYPDFAEKVALLVSRGDVERGIIICATGIGMSITANKIPGIRAAVCNDLYTARLSRLHNDANVLTFGSRVIGSGVAEEIVRKWLETPFEGGRHDRRVKKMAEVEGRHGGNRDERP